jgi:uncharacterized protein (TIGR02722 family)
MKILIVLITVFCLLAKVSCSSAPRVTRVDTDREIDLSGYWNDTDVRIVTEALIGDCINSPLVAQAINAMGRRPVVLVGNFRNESNEHIDTAIIASLMETAIFNSGKMDFVAGGVVREAIRTERQDQQTHASAASTSALANELGADFMLFGSVRTIVDRAANRTVRTYFVSAELTSVETNARIWMGHNDGIRKLVVQRRFRL